MNGLKVEDKEFIFDAKEERELVETHTEGSDVVER